MVILILKLADHFADMMLRLEQKRLYCGNGGSANVIFKHFL